MWGREDEQGSAAGGRSWGPFSGAQLTIVFCVLIVTVLFPVASYAVTGSTFFIGDPHNSNHAAVDAAGNLKAKVSGIVAIDGVAPGNIAQTNKFLQSRTIIPSPSSQEVLEPPSGRELIVTSLHVDWFAADLSTYPYMRFAVANPSTCTSPMTYNYFYTDLPTASGHDDPHFSPGFIVPAGKALCVVKGGTGNGYVTAFGYSVPAGSVAAPSANVSASPHAIADPR